VESRHGKGDTADHRSKHLHKSDSRESAWGRHVTALGKRVEIELGTILFATDFSVAAEKAGRYVKVLAQRYASKVQIAHVVGSFSYIPGRGRRNQHRYLSRIRRTHPQKVKEQFAAEGFRVETTLCERTDPARRILEITKEKSADLVVTGTRGEITLARLALGPVADQLIHHADPPVHSLRTAQYATSIAQQSGATLTVLHVLSALTKKVASQSETEEQDAVKELRQIAPDDTELENRIHFEITRGEPAQEILRIAKDTKAGLVVMGVSGRALLAGHVPWAVLSKVIRGAHCPVLAVQSHLV
jgi:nucleotide-binding universal stress UspA family protein